MDLLTFAASPSWLESVLGEPKQGVFSASFEGVNNTVLEFDDGDNAIIDCKVFLKQDKTVSVRIIICFFFVLFLKDHVVTTHWGNIRQSGCS